jgi:hypothetical protein
VPKVIFSSGENGRIVDVTPALCIEIKTPTGRQSPEQRAWQAAIEAQGYKYAIARDVLGFVKIIQEYLNKTR